MKSLSLSQPHLLVTVGIPGSGKSFFAAKFAATFTTPYVNYDTIMSFTDHNHAVSDAYAGYMLKELFKTRRTVIFDGSAGNRTERSALRDLAASAGYATLFVWVQTDEATARARFAKKSQKNGHHATGALYESLLQGFTPPTDKDDVTVVISGRHTYATQAKAVLKTLALSKQASRTAKAHTHPSSTTLAIPASVKRKRTNTIQ